MHNDYSLAVDAVLKIWFNFPAFAKKKNTDCVNCPQSLIECKCKNHFKKFKRREPDNGVDL